MDLFMHRRPLYSMKRFYNWFNKYYGGIEDKLEPAVRLVIHENVANIPDITNKTALDYACGTGMLTLQIAKLFRMVEARDASAGMLYRAKIRAAEAGMNIAFREGNILEVDEADDSYDYVFVSFALHLFSPEKEVEILRNLLRIAREAVIIIDHSRKWTFPLAVAEWFEGSYYDRFIKMDFDGIGQQIGAKRFEEKAYENIQSVDCTYMAFYK